MEDLTDPELVRTDPKMDRTVSVYGYLRGTNLKPSTKVHIPGLGDYSISTMSILPDPCPIPEKTRKMNEKHKLIFAPMSDVGGILYDKDAIYINVPGQFSREDQSAETGFGERLVMELQDANETIEDKVKQSEMRLFNKSELVNASDYQHLVDQESDDEEEIDEEEMDIQDEEEDDDDLSDLSDNEDDEPEDDVSGRNRRKVKSGIMNAHVDSDTVEFAESDSDLGLSEDYSDIEEDEETQVILEADGSLKWKDLAIEKTQQRFKRQTLTDFVYKSTAPTMDYEEVDSEEEVEEDSIFVKKTKKVSKSLLMIDTSKIEIPMSLIEQWDDEDLLQDLKSRFITKEEKPAEDEEDPNVGDFEDLENPQASKSKPAEPAEDEVLDIDAERDKNAKRKEELKAKFNNEYDGESDGDEEKQTFYEHTKDEMARQAQINREEFANEDPETRAQIEGYRAGLYVRIVFTNIPCEFSENFDPDYPIIVGGLLSTEEATGFIQVRIKKHRWHKKILKTNDPLIFSLGWRRFQTMPLYSLDNDGTRNRMLKYTPEHMHCLATFFGIIFNDFRPNHPTEHRFLLSPIRIRSNFCISNQRYRCRVG